MSCDFFFLGGGSKKTINLLEFKSYIGRSLKNQISDIKDVLITIQRKKVKQSDISDVTKTVINTKLTI
jgi:hypothetical protein